MRIELNTEDGNSLFMKNAYVPRETGVSHDGTLAGLSLSEMKETVIKLARLVKTNVLKSSRSTDGDWDIVETGFTSGALVGKGFISLNLRVYFETELYHTLLLSFCYYCIVFTFLFFIQGEPDSGDVCVDQGFRCLAGKAPL